MRYFAYGSNLLLARLRERSPSTKRIARARLPAHRLCWHKRGTLDGSGKCDAWLTGHAKDTVWGALFEIADTERARLDTAEGLGLGYRATLVQVETTGGVRTAFVYVATPDAVDDTLAPFDWYRDLVVAGARESTLPARYISTLAAVPAIVDPDTDRAHCHRRLIGRIDDAEQKMPTSTVATQAPHTGHTTLRSATETDQTAIINICKRSITTTYGVFMHAERMRPWVDGQEVEHYVARMWPHMTVAVAVNTDTHEQLVGVVALDGHVIDLLWIRVDLRGQGIGSVLMNQAELMLAVDYPMAELECFAPNHSSLAFYAARGYRAVRTYYEAASGVDRIVMTKRLGGL